MNWLQNLVNLYQKELNITYEEIKEKCKIIEFYKRGFVAYRISEDQATLYIDAIAVMPDEQRKTVASQLLNQVKRLNKSILVAARQENNAANKMYLKSGFIDIGDVPGQNDERFTIYAYN